MRTTTISEAQINDGVYYLGGVHDSNRIFGSWDPVKKQWHTWLVTLTSSDKLCKEWDEDQEKSRLKTICSFMRYQWLPYLATTRK